MLKIELMRYSKNVLKDQPLSCKKHKWAAERFLRDLKRQGTEEFPYVFIPEKAERFFNWCEMFKHRKGKLAGQYIKLAPILRFIFGNIYGWYHKDTGYRRFDKLYWQVARKNAKSQMLSLVASYELIAFNETGDEAQEVYCAATKREQAKIVFDETKGMLLKCPDLKHCYKTVNNMITHIKSGSFMRVLSEEDRKTGDGLNPSCGIVDEYHAHDTSEMYDVIDSGMGARSQPLLAIITTAGFNLNNPCFRVEYQMATNILDPDNPVEMENYFAMINELDKDENGELIDDLKDPNVWVKANPIICSYPEGVEYLKKRMKEAIEIPEKLRNFLTKNMNIWIHLTEVSYMSTARWAKCKRTIRNLQNRNVYIGVDFSSKIDLTSVGMIYPYGDKYIVQGHSFMPEETYEKKRKTDKVPYELWAKQGWLTIQPGPIVDYKAAIQQILDLIEKNKLYAVEWCLDPWCASQIMSWLIDEKGQTVVDIRQGMATLSEPTKDFRDMVYKEMVLQDGNPLIAWAIGNAMLDEDKNKNIMLNKKKSPQRIDPIASIINAHVRCMNSDLDGDPKILLF